MIKYYSTDVLNALCNDRLIHWLAGRLGEIHWDGGVGKKSTITK